jgi:hypothetical protein
MNTSVDPDDDGASASPDGRARDLSPRMQRASVVVWCSFLAAGAATTVVFAFLDPAAVPLGEVPSWWQGRHAVYAIGFLFFWVVSAAASALTLFMVRTQRDDAPGNG